MRQKDDKHFADILNRLRVGDHTFKDIKTLTTRVIDASSPDYPYKVPHIFLRNEQVNAHNDQAFLSSPLENRVTVQAKDVVVGDVSNCIKDKILAAVPTGDPSKTMGLFTYLRTAVGLRCEISINVDVEDGLSNGASGVLMGVCLPKTGHRPMALWIDFDQETIGKSCRDKNKHLYTKQTHPHWTPLLETNKIFPVGRYKSAQVLRTQFPIRPASAKTVHRCQGDTMQSLVVDLSGRTNSHAHYAALSRVTAMQNLFITCLNEQKISIDPHVKSEMNRLNKSAHLKLNCNLCSLAADDKFTVTVLFHNVQSLHHHYKDILQEPNYSAANLCMFAESRLCEKDNLIEYHIPNFDLHNFTWPAKGKERPYYGIAVYIKKGTKLSNIQYFTISHPLGTIIEYVILK